MGRMVQFRHEQGRHDARRHSDSDHRWLRLRASPSTARMARRLITHLASNTEPARPATSARRSTIPRVFINSSARFLVTEQFSFSRTTGSPSCRSSSTSGRRTAIRNMTGTSGSRLARDRKFSSRSISRWRSRRGSITPTAGAANTTAGCASSPSRRKSERDRKFFSRPVLRAFLTYANWSDGLRGFVGGVPFLKPDRWPDLRSAGRNLVVAPESEDKWQLKSSDRPDTDTKSSAVAPAATNYTRPLAIVTTLFFMWGFLTCLNDILVPHLKSIFDLSYARVMLVQFAFFSAYFLFSVPWSRVVNAIGYQRTMVAGLLTMAVGAFLFLPAASAASYPLFLTALIVLAAGITGLQVAANPYVALLGKACNGIEPAGSDAGVQLARHHDRPENRRTADPERGAAGDRTVAATHAASSAGVSRARSGLGQDALHRDRRCAGVAGGFDRHFQAAKNRSRCVSAGRKSQRFDLEASQSLFRRDWNLRLRGRGSFHRKLSGELFRFARDRGPVRQRPRRALFRSTGAAP